MTDDPENLTLRMLQRMDEKLDRILAELSDNKPQLTPLTRATNMRETHITSARPIPQEDGRLRLDYPPVKED